MAAQLDVIDCCQCKVAFGLPSDVHRVLRQSSQTFFCPYGHKNYYPPKAVVDQDQREKDTLRQERDRLKQQLAEKDDRIAAERQWRELADRKVIAAKGQITKLKKRAQNGVCPCCNRTFVDLQRHMASKHPAFEKEPDATDNVVKLKTA